ncbi:MAG: hypothetical protein HND40_11515 [Ignavibacteriota bacterium]|nr:hypothetical protein [Ignavibacteriota bacterium]MCO6446478.1 hypothetical protein [Ignavibacterium album]QKK00158.1 MAG: hypothetical protein HND40_11515 [Ignavibacteriota bacterium]HOJ06407.1 hypothetical protein [Ignavibacteriaceae bacterium]
MRLNFAGVKRKELYSPNHITNDSLILNITAEVLKTFGHKVSIYDESFIETYGIEEDYIFSMAQGIAGLSKLKEIESEGRFIINSPTASLNSYRTTMIKMLTDHKVPFPKSILLNDKNISEDYFGLFGAKKLWLKRGDVHAEHKEDVTLIYSKGELLTTLEEFTRRGIKNAIIQEHLPGDTIKFYGITEGDYFYWYYLNGNNHIPFEIDKLKKLAFTSAQILGLDVFGGDVIISPTGSISVIDVNDWPSFAPVRDKAAEAIGKLIHRKVLDYVNQN